MIHLAVGIRLTGVVINIHELVGLGDVLERLPVETLQCIDSIFLRRGEVLCLRDRRWGGLRELWGGGQYQHGIIDVGQAHGL